MTDHEIQDLVATQIKTASAPAAKPRFDSTINLGHLLTILTILGGGFAVYISSHDASISNQYDISENKKAISELRETTKSIAANNANISNTLEKLSWIVESIQRDNKIPSKQ